ncbi:MAG TPA: hypothetical protein VM219_00220 [Phycisphaerae bacterium]|nr:hypothetical protein [Phycisphaerae bacterium]
MPISTRTVRFPSGLRRLAQARWLMAVCLIALAAGCQPQAERKPQLYCLRGRVLDAETGEGLPRAHLWLRAGISTAFGSRSLATAGITKTDGTYELELGEGFDVVQLAHAIHASAGKPGYAPKTTNLPTPTKAQPFYVAPDIILSREKAKPFATGSPSGQ